MRATDRNVHGGDAGRQVPTWLPLLAAAKHLDVVPSVLWRAVRRHPRAWAKPGGVLHVNVAAAERYLGRRDGGRAA